jgi:hypothetical protein
MAREIQPGTDYGQALNVKVSRPLWRISEDKGTAHDVAITRVPPLVTVALPPMMAEKRRVRLLG